MWGELFRTNLIFALRGAGAGESAVIARWMASWLVRELAWWWWWWLASVLAAVSFWLLARSEMGRWGSAGPGAPRRGCRGVVPDPRWDRSMTHV
jgi:hypothetical protein